VFDVTDHPEQSQRHVVLLVDERVRRHARLAHFLGDRQDDQLAETASPVIRLDDQRAEAPVATAHRPRQQLAVEATEHAQTDVEPDRVPKVRLWVHVAVRPQRVDEIQVVHAQLADENVRRHSGNKR